MLQFVDADVELSAEISDDLAFCILAVPKSANTKCQFSFSKILHGFRSLCTIFFYLRKLKILVN